VGLWRRRLLGHVHPTGCAIEQSPAHSVDGSVRRHPKGPAALRVRPSERDPARFLDAVADAHPHHPCRSAASWQAVDTSRRPLASFTAPIEPGKTPRRRRFERGGFKTLELNAVGWSALLGAGALVDVILAAVVVEPAPIALVVGAVGGAGVSYTVARVRDDLRERRRLSNVAVSDAQLAVAQLWAWGIKASGDTHVDAQGVTTAYVTVYARDVWQARQLVGLPRTSRRAGRCARDAEYRAQYLPRLRPKPRPTP
jgi:hypothetical protein